MPGRLELVFRSDMVREQAEPWSWPTLGEESAVPYCTVQYCTGSWLAIKVLGSIGSLLWRLFWLLFSPFIVALAG